MRVLLCFKIKTLTISTVYFLYYAILQYGHKQDIRID